VRYPLYVTSQLLIISLTLGLHLHPHSALAQEPKPADPPPSAQEEAPPASAQATPPKWETRPEYALRLRRPAPHWRLLKRDEARRLSGIATVGAVEPGRSFGLVLVEPARGMSLEDYAQAIINNSPLEELLLEASDVLTYQGQESFRLMYSGDNDEGARVRYLSYVFIRDRFAFQVSAGGRVGALSPQELEPFSRAVELLPGPVQGAELKVTPLQDELGLTWRSQRGRFESLLGAFSLTPPEGWSVQTGDAARAISPIATLSMTKRVAPNSQAELDLSVLISARPCADVPKRCKAWASAELIEAFELTPRNEGQLEWRVFGEPASFELFDREGTPFSYALTTLVRGEEVLQVLAWTLKAQLPYAWAPLPEALGGLGELTSAQRAELKAKISTAARSDRGAGLRGDSLDASSAWLGGRYEHEGYGVSWRMPSGLWSAQRRERGQSLSVLAFEAPLFGLQGQLRVTRRGGGLIEAHSEALDALKRELGGSLSTLKSGEGQLGGTLSYFSELQETGPRPLRYRLHTALKGGVATYLITWAPAPRFPELVIKQAESQLTLGAYSSPFAMTTRCEPTSRCLTQLSLSSMRFQLKGLPAGGDVTFQPNASVGERSMSLTYQVEDALIGAVAVGHARPDALEPLAIAAAQRLIPKLEGATLSPQRVWVEGREARRLSWTSAQGEVRLYLIKRPPLIYGYFVIAPLGHPLLEGGQVKLSLLD